MEIKAGKKQAASPSHAAASERADASAAHAESALAPVQAAQLAAVSAMAMNSPQSLQLRRFQDMADQGSAPVVQLRARVDGRPPLGAPLQRQENRTGMPDQLKSGIESMSGYSMDSVKVHYNSAKPATVQAHAYAQGTDIHLASGQEKHLPHEAWHVVQQMQGRVKPTTSVGGQAVNDNSGLEREADVMGSRAMQLKVDDAGEFTKIASSTGTIQRKVNTNLTALPNTGAFQDNAWTAVREGINDYNQVPDDQVYVKQKQQLNTLIERATLAYHDNIMAFDREDVRAQDRLQQMQQDEEIGNYGFSIIAEEQERDSLQADRRRISDDIQGGVDKLLTDQDIEKYRLYRQPELDAKDAEINAVNATLSADQQQFAALTQEQQQLTQRHQDLTGYMAELRQFNGQVVAGELKTELQAVKGQMDDPNAKMPAIPSNTKKRKGITNRPAELNALASQFEQVADDHVKFNLLYEMEEKIDSWKKQYVEPNGRELKPNLKNPVDRQEKWDAIQLMQEQILYARKALFTAIFQPGNINGPSKKNVIGGLLQDTTAAVVSSAGSQATGAKADLDKITGKTVTWKFKEENPDVIGKNKIDPSADVRDGIGLGGAAGDGINQIYAFFKNGEEWLKSKGEKRFKLTFDEAESAVKVSRDVFSIGNAAKNLDGKEGEERRKITKVGDMDTWGKGVYYTSGLTAAVSAAKNAVLTFISIRNFFQRKGIDDEKAFENLGEGGINLASAAQGILTATKNVLKIADTALAPVAQAAIPILGIVINVGKAALNFYQAHNAVKKEDDLKRETDKFVPNDNPNDVDRLANATKLTSQNITDLTEIQTQGVFGLVGSKQYRRFNAFVMSQIDKNLEQNAGQAFSVRVDGVRGHDIPLSVENIDKIREYEYLSKMQEINQKRKFKGRTDAGKNIVSAVGDLASFSGVGAVIGTGIKIGVAAFDVGHSVSKGIQQGIRNSKRSTMDKAIAADGSFQGDSIADVPNLAAYKAFRGDDDDKSTKQKETDYRRHARYILDRIASVNLPQSLNDPRQIDQMKNEYEGTKKLLLATGVDFYSFLHASDIGAKFDLIVASQKTGR